MRRFRAIAAWFAIGFLVVWPLFAASQSELLAWRDPTYIAAGFAGIFAMSLLLVQPILAAELLPGLSRITLRQIHRWTGVLLVISVAAHVAGLWITSPPDVFDVLLFRSPTAFSVWGVVAMWALVLAAVLAATRRRWRWPYALWRGAHISLAIVVVTGSVVHAVLIEGTMGTMSKWILCAAVLAATLKVAADFWIWVIRKGPSTKAR